MIRGDTHHLVITSDVKFMGNGSEWMNDGIATSLHIPAASAMEDIHDNTDTSTILVVHMNLQQQRKLAAAAAAFFLTCTMYQLLRPPQHMIVNGTLYSSKGSTLK